MTPARALRLAIQAHEAGHYTSAEYHYRRVLDVDPHHTGARAALLDIEARLLHEHAMHRAAFGDLDEAIATWDHALKMGPKYFGFYIGMLRLGSTRHIEEMLKLDPEQIRPEHEALYNWAMHKACRAIGDHQNAFSHLLVANKLHRAPLNYDEVAELMYLGRIVATFTPDLLQHFNWCGVKTKAPIFIVGLPRSGTTLVEQMLAGHPDVHACGELQHMGHMAHDVSFPEICTSAEWGYQGFDAFAEDYLAQVPEHDTPRFTDKMPDNSRFVAMIRIMMPNAKIVHVRRNLADTALSYFAELFLAGNPWSYDLEELGRYILAHERMMNWWKRLGVPMIEVTYETLVQDTETTLRGLLDNLDLRWSPGCLDFHTQHRPVLTASIAQIRQPIYSSSIGTWTRHKEGLKPLLTILERGGLHFR